MRGKPKSGIPKAVQTVRQCPERKIPVKVLKLIICPRNSPRKSISEGYRMEIVALQDLFASTDSVRTGRVIKADTGPLVDG